MLNNVHSFSKGQQAEMEMKAQFRGLLAGRAGSGRPKLVLGSFSPVYLIHNQQKGGKVGFCN